MRDPGNLGGLYGFTVEFFTTFSVQHFVNLILDGVAYDLIKSGSDALVLRPFIAAYNALKRKNADRSSRVHVSRLRLSFQDSVVVIHGLRRSEEHTSELQSQFHLVCRLLLEKKK